MDLRQMGQPYEKKYVELVQEERDKVTATYHAWQTTDYDSKYENVPEFCYSADRAEIAEKGYTLVPSRYIEFVNRDENIDFDTKMKGLQTELTELLKEEEVAVVPGTAFGACGEGFLRISYAYSLENLKIAMERIGRFLEKRKKS